MTRRHTTGFTLLEIMLVMVLLGVLAGVVVPTLPQRSNDEAKREAERFYQLIQLWTEKALISGQTYGLRIDDDNRYQLLHLENNDWVVAPEERTPTQITLPEGIEIELEVSGFVAEEDQLFSRESMFSDDDLFESGLSDEDEEKKLDPPQVVLMGNGEVIAFTLDFLAEGRALWQVKANDVATFELNAADEDS